ncbi:hypothetical protein DACRYDRAFT_23295 [Dacryopinax primogenitus]|uniref:Uncharacterized protein n=1 Tax=Dacryopinax primogenitus (strain DJM 731) TaxID=1858805 RepID=M5G3F6_DACPD|nr:uncharacterized protein DACRYDRAFT_23295 [Dacryopinax primogenitus]EJU00407.1 hypothetical protein DACRYDRAFT_23295 [Dacryopinax primogenitus]
MQYVGGSGKRNNIVFQSFCTPPGPFMSLPRLSRLFYGLSPRRWRASPFKRDQDSIQLTHCDLHPANLTVSSPKLRRGRGALGSMAAFGEG